MTQLKSAPVSYRMRPETKELLALCAEHEHRSMSSMLEYMVHTYAAGQGITLPTPAPAAKTAKNTTKKP
ncbi:MAG: hypothetical protein L0H10_03500 [Comamonas sp.]|uniref:hypothetical protein n=1 Tax=Comamonas sp. TaxID=34028 RepID=UPI0026481DA6|nr:hypothetical protein [Comamonas sp.]MDN5502877.1 hypothetical protein [Comamonas sp.]MDN5539085.1 hypothetical protein [Comamonas sp.]